MNTFNNNKNNSRNYYTLCKLFDLVRKQISNSLINDFKKNFKSYKKANKFLDTQEDKKEYLKKFEKSKLF